MDPKQALNVVEQFRLRLRDAQFSGADHDALREAVATLAKLIDAKQE